MAGSENKTGVPFIVQTPLVRAIGRHEPFPITAPTKKNVLAAHTTNRRLDGSSPHKARDDVKASGSHCLERELQPRSTNSRQAWQRALSEHWSTYSRRLDVRSCLVGRGVVGDGWCYVWRAQFFAASAHTRFSATSICGFQRHEWETLFRFPISSPTRVGLIWVAFVQHERSNPSITIDARVSYVSLCCTSNTYQIHIVLHQRGLDPNLFRGSGFGCPTHNRFNTVSELNFPGFCFIPLTRQEDQSWSCPPSPLYPPPPPPCPLNIPQTHARPALITPHTPHVFVPLV